MFENKYAKLPDEPPITNVENDPVSSVSTVRNNGPLPPSAGKRIRNTSKNNVGISGQQSSMITSSDDGGSSDESSGDDMQVNDENTLRQLRVLQDQIKYFGDTINQLIQKENDRLTIRRKGKHNVKRNKTKVRGPRQTSTLSNIPMLIPNAVNDPNRVPSLSSTNPSLLPPHTFQGTQGSMLPTATRNPSVNTTTKRSGSSTLAGLLAPTISAGYPTGGALVAPNGTSQFSNVHPGQYLLTDTKPQATKNTTPMTGISAGLASRGSGKGGRGVGAGGTGQKRLVGKCLCLCKEKIYSLEHQRKPLQQQCNQMRMFNQQFQHLILKVMKIPNQ
jgi:hypothetical protein